VEFDSDNVESKPEDYFSQFVFVCITNAALPTLVRLDYICRLKGIGFMAAETFGFYGFFFEDLQDFSYNKEDIPKGKQPAGESSERNVKRQKVRQISSFVSLEKALSVSWGLLKRMSKLYPIIHTLHHYRNEYGRYPHPDDSDDQFELLQMYNKLSSSPLSEADKGFGLFKEVSRLAGIELSPVCAILGGISAQEIIKILTVSDEPFNNFFFYNAKEGSGVVECISVM